MYFKVLSLEQLDKRKKNIIAFYYIFELNLEPNSGIKNNVVISVVTFEPADEIPKCDPTRVKATEKYFTVVLAGLLCLIVSRF